MKKSTIFLQIVIVFIGIVTIALMLYEPQIEGRNVHSTLFQIYFNDPFLAYVYLSSIPLFIALYKAFNLFKYIRQNKIFSLASIQALRTIKYSAISIIISILGAEAYLFIIQRGREDIAGGVFIGLVLIFFSTIIAVSANLFEYLLNNLKKDL